MITDRDGDLATRVCDACGDVRTNVSYWNLTRKDIHRCYSCSNKLTNLGKISPFKGSKKKPKHVGRGYTHSDGYPMCWVGKDRSKTGYMLTHRVVAGNARGRMPDNIEKVHHVNGNRNDYRVDNLYICKDMSHHRKVHDNLENVAMELVRARAIKFDQVNGQYYIDEKLKFIIEDFVEEQPFNELTEKELKTMVEETVGKIDD